MTLFTRAQKRAPTAVIEHLRIAWEECERIMHIFTRERARRRDEKDLANSIDEFKFVFKRRYVSKHLHACVRESSKLTTYLSAAAICGRRVSILSNARRASGAQ